MNNTVCRQLYLLLLYGYFLEQRILFIHTGLVSSPQRGSMDTMLQEGIMVGDPGITRVSIMELSYSSV